MQNNRTYTNTHFSNELYVNEMNMILFFCMIMKPAALTPMFIAWLTPSTPTGTLVTGFKCSEASLFIKPSVI